ncbi:zinc-binding alcohol dehydrogenase family protein [Leifsonia sp. ZF2019]|uniref:quinone oxidoreductase family protein n=1 Tax=Leifsonia sp. ZF2019 TaxID=2781978 RepID=UPI001CBED51E|nr:zinc-binding alcohol dehydrogenase family protein [Leifsonia sp. ZF2019]UAJ79195.1 zinc-binding alcohol dehydrogenase family protein [Leifsonia sp. ZF2019]
MRAAVVTSFDSPPEYAEWPEPAASSDDSLVVDVLAAALHPRVRSQADGSHYTSTGDLPFVPGIDAVVRDASGHLRYALLHESELGTFAERTVVPREATVPLPDDIDVARVAAAMNPVMSSWVALRRRIAFQPDSRVLVLGATGNAGRLALQVARTLGASEVIAAGRDAHRTASLLGHGADTTIGFDELSRAADVDVVLDYVWGAPTERALVDVVTARSDRSRPLHWVEIGSVAGPTASIPSAAFRAARLDLVGSGIGSVSAAEFGAELPAIAEAVSRGTFDVEARPVHLSDLTAVWAEDPGAAGRVVFVP